MTLGIAASPVRTGIVVGQSMSPTLRPWQPFLYTAFQAGRTPIHRGDIVLVRMGGSSCVKRVFALGGDHFWVMDDALDEDMAVLPLGVGIPVKPWKARFPVSHFRKVTIPRNAVYVLGENPTSLDSRQLGPVSRADVIGRVVLPGPPDRGPDGDSLVFIHLPRRPRKRLVLVESPARLSQHAGLTVSAHARRALPD
jgi:signal peptidase I